MKRYLHPIAALATCLHVGGLVATLLILGAGVPAISSCRTAQDGLMRITTGVPDPTDCVPDTQRCLGNVPVVCSATQRYWPTLPRDPSGRQRECLGGCAVTDAGVAYCLPERLPPRDGGAE